MDISQLSYLVGFVKSKSYSATAKHAYVTPQTISKSIAKLERELGVSLMKKDGRRSVPTDTACEIAVFADEALQSISAIRDLARQRQQKSVDRGSIRLALPKTAWRGCPLEESELNDFREEYPNVEFSVDTYTSEACRVALRNGLADTIIVMGKLEDQDFEYTMVGEARAHVIVSASSPYANHDSLTLDTLAEMPIAMPSDLSYGYSTLLSAMRKRDLQPVFKTMGSTAEEHREFILEGGAMLAFANSPLLSEFSDLKAVPLQAEESPSWPLFLVYRASSEPSPIPLLAEYLRNLPKIAAT